MPLAHRIIRSEHFELSLVLACLSQLAQDASREPDFDVLYLILDYIEGFPETFHHPKEEAHLCNQLLASRKGNVVETLQDVWWAVLNSNEFILIQ